MNAGGKHVGCIFNLTVMMSHLSCRNSHPRKKFGKFFRASLMFSKNLHRNFVQLKVLWCKEVEMLYFSCGSFVLLKLKLDH